MSRRDSTMRSTVLAAMITGLALAGLTACGSDESESAKTSQPTTTAATAATTTGASAGAVAAMCTLLPTADVERITGFAPTEAIKTDNDTCSLPGADDDFYVYGVRGDASKAGADLCSADRVPRLVEGVGQKACTAFWDNGTQGYTVIRFVAETHLFSIEIHYRAADVADYPADKAVALANLVVANLG